MSNIQADIAKLEAMRKKIATTIVVLVVVWLTLFIAFVILSQQNNSSDELLYMVFAGLISLAAIGIVFGYIVPQTSKYKTFYKDVFLVDCLKSVFDNVEFNQNRHIEKDIIEQSMLAPIGNRFKGDDYLKATYKGINFEQCDIVNKHVVSSGKNSTTITYFYGRWVVIDYPQAKGESLTIREKEMGGAAKGIINTKGQQRLEKINLEKIQFNSNFEVRSTNQIFAFKVLTPSFIETIESAQQQIEGQIMISFSKDKLHLALHTNRNAFEPSLFTQITENDKEKILKDARITCELIDKLVVI